MEALRWFRIFAKFFNRRKGPQIAQGCVFRNYLDDSFNQLNAAIGVRTTYQGQIATTNLIR
jgi:hypothetical protein